MASSDNLEPSNLLGVILAGGRAKRFEGRDKLLLPLAGRPLLDHLIVGARAQLAALLLNINDDPARRR